MSLNFKSFSLNKKEQIAISVISIGFLWTMLLFAAASPQSLMKLQIGEPFPTEPPTEIHIVLNFGDQITINEAENTAVVNPLMALLTILGGCMGFILTRIYNWLKSKKIIIEF